MVAKFEISPNHPIIYNFQAVYDTDPSQLEDDGFLSQLAGIIGVSPSDQINKMEGGVDERRLGGA